MSKKIFLLFICVVITGFMVITSQRVAVKADVLPTNAPAEETIISQNDLHATQTALPSMYPVPSEVVPVPTENPYPEPQSVSLEDVLKSIFGNIISKGKQSLQKK